ncbi:MAG: hypothetical protein QG583_195 [Patescibacteria group bacterium]|nr:hypothetical protein [Patescibacteria group bacterium]
MNIEWIIIWLVFWGAVMGGVNFLFKKYKITYYQYPWQHTLFFLFAIGTLCLVYKEYFINYFKDMPPYFIPVIFLLFISWIAIPRFYKNDYFIKTERTNYQVVKFFEILFQQLAFLGGLLTFGVAPFVFGLVFFLIHLPTALFIPKGVAVVFTSGSLIGGIIFSYLQSQGLWGFVLSLLVHITFYLVFFYKYNILKPLLGSTPHKR